MMSESRAESGRQEHFPVLFEGPLAVFAEGFAAWLLERGYRPRSVRVQLRLLGDLSCWLAREGREPAGLTAEDTARFLSARRARVVDLTGARALGALLGYLRGLGVVAAAAGFGGFAG